MLIRWNDPFREMHGFQREMNRLFNEALTNGGRNEREGVAFAWAPPVDVAETPDKLVFSVEVPGFKEEELTLRAENGVLMLEGERKFEEETKDKSYHRVERAYGKFHRSFTLPTNVDVSKVSADLEGGVLRIELPKREDTLPKSIPIGGQKQIGPRKTDKAA